MNEIVGMSRSIRLEWLDEVAQMVVNDKNEKEIKDLLNEYLSFDIKSATNLRKTREILMNIWVRSTADNRYIKELAKKAYNVNKPANNLALHWCLILITYPVFADLTTVIGKLNDMQADITTSQLKEKMYDIWGERTTLLHSIDKNIKTLKDLGVIQALKVGHFKTNQYRIDNKDVQTIMISTLLLLQDKLYLTIDELKNRKEFFAFQYDVDVEHLQDTGWFSFDKFGGEMVLSRGA